MSVAISAISPHLDFGVQLVPRQEVQRGQRFVSLQGRSQSCRVQGPHVNDLTIHGAIVESVARVHSVPANRDRPIPIKSLSQTGPIGSR
jgi:hypothetical protein